MQGLSDGDFALGVFVAFDQRQVRDDGRARVVGQVAREFVRDPAMDTTTTTVDPHDVLKAKVICRFVGR